MNILKKIKKYAILCSKINVWQTIRINQAMSIPRNATVRVFNYSNININKESMVDFKPKSYLGINVLNLKRKRTRPCTLWLSKNAQLVCNGSFTMFEGAVIVVLEGGRIELGSRSYMNESVIQCSSQVIIGDGCAIASGVLIQDTDFHTVVENGISKTSVKPITISNKVWICANATILKGVTVGEGSIVAAGAVVTKDVPPNCIVAGNPAKVIKTNVSWL